VSNVPLNVEVPVDVMSRIRSALKVPSITITCVTSSVASDSTVIIAGGYAASK
jgi:hypothetical protein